MSAQRVYEADGISEAQFFEMVENSTVRLEFIDGWVRAMAGGKPNHSTLFTRFATALNNRLGHDHPCEARVADVYVKSATNNARYLPDVVVFCEDAEFDARRPDVLLSPTVIVEVLSNSTSAIDRTEKLDAYRSIASLRHYLMVDQNRVRIEHYRRTPEGWHYEVYLWNHDEIPFDDLNIRIPVAEIYRRMDLPEGFVLLTEDSTE